MQPHDGRYLSELDSCVSFSRRAVRAYRAWPHNRGHQNWRSNMRNQAGRPGPAASWLKSIVRTFRPKQTHEDSIAGALIASGSCICLGGSKDESIALTDAGLNVLRRVFSCRVQHIKELNQQLHRPTEESGSLSVTVLHNFWLDPSALPPEHSNPVQRC